MPENIKEFIADPGLCIACGQCVADCPARVLTIENGVAVPLPDFAEDCIACQHCLAICPTAAVSVAGRNPEASLPVSHGEPEQLERLILSRRSYRKFSPQTIEREVIASLLDTVAHAPTGVNARYRRFTVVSNPGLEVFRDKACSLLVERKESLPERIQWLASAASAWLDDGRDVIFRDAPHLLVVSSGPEASTIEADCLIAISYFDLLAQAHGIGTVWVGMVHYLLQALPEMRELIGLPVNHVPGYSMMFGIPAVQYRRTAQHDPEKIYFVDSL